MTSARASATTLLLTAGELAGSAILQSLELDQRERVGDPAFDLGPGDAAHPQAIADIGRHVHVREQRVVLEHDPDFAPVAGKVGDAPAIDRDLAAVRHQEAGNQVEQRGLAAARRPEQRHQLAAADQQRQLVERGGLAEAFRDAVEPDRDGLAVQPGRGGRSGKRTFSGTAQR